MNVSAKKSGEEPPVAGDIYGSRSFLPMRAVALNPPFNKLVGKIPPSALAVPSMMSTAERRFLFGLAQTHYTGQGCIVDAGLFLGASTRCFGEGLLDNRQVSSRRKPGKPLIHSFERGLINAGMPAFFERNNVPFEGRVGDSFEPLLQANVAPVTSVVDLRVGDILQSGGVQEPIEILYLDVLKSEELTYYCFKEFYPKLIPEISIVLQQDYFFDGLPFIKTYQEHVAHCFEFLGEICSMAVFKCIRAVPELEAPLEQTLSAAEQLRLSSIALQRSVDPSRRFMMAVSKLRLIRKRKGVDAAAEYLRHIESDYPEQVAMAGQQSGRLKDIWRTAQKLVRGAVVDETDEE